MARSLNTIAREISKDWGAKLSVHASPYLNAMYSLETMTDYYGADSARSIVAYFLSNATTWKGEKAREIKKELNSMLKK